MKKETRLVSMALVPIALLVGLALGNMHCSMLGNTDCGVFGNADCGSGSSPGTFTTTGSMVTARFLNTATLLPGGKVLIAGGSGSSGVLASAELYDPVSGTFTATGSMTTERQSHTATLLPSGKVLIAGGDTSSSSLTSAELYDPVAGTFTATGSMATTREFQTATLLTSGKVLIVGGIGTSGNSAFSLASAELYDPVMGTFTATGNLATARYLHTATSLPGGKVLIAGGEGGEEGNPTYVVASAELYDPDAGTFTTTGSLVTGREYHTATPLPNGKVLIAGGQNIDYSVLASAELYDPDAGTFTATGSMATTREFHTATLLTSGKVLIAGGATPVQPWPCFTGGMSNIVVMCNSVGLASAELYDQDSDTFTATGSMATARSDHTATLLLNGNVLIAGGGSALDSLIGDSLVASAELYR
jgi:hypothetical protein